MLSGATGSRFKNHFSLLLEHLQCVKMQVIDQKMAGIDQAM